MRVIYVYDALCGWCYGFSPVIREVYNEYRKKLPFEVISGGMISGDRVGPIGEVASYISEAYKVVEDTTGVEFGSAFLEDVLADGKTVFDSLPPSKALTAFKTFKPEQAVLFASEIQSAIYHDGLDPNDDAVYSELASHYDIEKKKYKAIFSAPETEMKTREEFIFSSKLGVNGFPTVFFEYENQYQLIARGYTSHNVLQNRLDHVINRAGKIAD